MVTETQASGTRRVCEQRKKVTQRDNTRRTDEAENRPRKKEKWGGFHTTNEGHTKEGVQGVSRDKKNRAGKERKTL